MALARPTQRLTDKKSWDDYWGDLALPVEAKKGQNHSHDQILGVLDRFIPPMPGLSALEIGGAPGQYLAYVVKRFGHRGHILDYSGIGCEKSTANFKMLGLPLEVHLGDLFADDLQIGPFDIVYSLGFIEHFTDMTDVIGRHVRLGKPGGTLVVGCPNFRGINGWFLRHLAPQLLSTHNTAMMDIATWTHFEKAHSLKVLFRGYVGGFEPSVFCRRETRNIQSDALLLAAKTMRRLFSPQPFKRVNSPAFSHYAMAAYRLPG